MLFYTNDGSTERTCHKFKVGDIVRVKPGTFPEGTAQFMNGKAGCITELTKSHVTGKGFYLVSFYKKRKPGWPSQWMHGKSLTLADTKHRMSWT